MKRRQGFSLIELLAVISIIVILMAILLPSLGRAKDQTRTAICLSNLRQINVAQGQYTTSNLGFLPIVADEQNVDVIGPDPWWAVSNIATSTIGVAISGWMDALEPYVGQGSWAKMPDWLKCPNTSLARPQFKYWELTPNIGETANTTYAQNCDWSVEGRSLNWYNTSFKTGYKASAWPTVMRAAIPTKTIAYGDSQYETSAQVGLFTGDRSHLPGQGAPFGLWHRRKQIAPGLGWSGTNRTFLDGHGETLISPPSSSTPGDASITIHPTFTIGLGSDAARAYYWLARKPSH